MLSAAVPLRFVLVEDEGVLRHLLHDTLQKRFPHAEITSCEVGAEGVTQSRRLRPTLAILDYGLPDLSGLAVARAVREVSPNTKMLMLTARVPDVPVADLIAAGITGLVDKAMPKDQLLAAVDCVLAGGFYLVAQKPPAGLPVSDANAARPIKPEVLTAQELEVARLITGGFSTKEIADQTNQPTRTVEKQRLRILQKLRLPNVAALIRWCLRNGIE